MRIIFNEPVESYSLNPDDNDSLDCKLPTLDARKRSLSSDDISRHIHDFTHTFWSREDKPIRDNEKIIADIEHTFLQQSSNNPEDEVTYGTIGTSNGMSGISDRGLFCYLFLNALDDSLGITSHQIYKWNPQAESYLKDIHNNHQVINEIVKTTGKYSFVNQGRICRKIEQLIGQQSIPEERDDTTLDISLEQITTFWDLLTVKSPANELVEERFNGEDMAFGRLISWYVELFESQGKLTR